MNVVVPILPIFEMPIQQLSVAGLAEHVAEFVTYKGYNKVHVLGNSLGGHIAILYALAHPEQIASITLTGSSGLFESAMGSTFPKRGDYDFIKKKTEATFYRPEIASQELIDEVFGIVNDRNRAIRIVATSKSAVRHNLGDNLHSITAPTLLLWGKDDQITPALMEQPEQFNQRLEAFLEEVTAKV
jgi:2-hydroxy-6-oxonona-2,4-dienedioate hydrolase